MARLGDEIDSSSTDSGDYIILKSGRKVERKSMDDAEWSAFVADAEKRGKLKLVSKSDDTVDDVQLPTVETVKAAMAAKKDKATLDTSDLKADTRTVEEAGEEEAAKAEKVAQKPKAQKKAKVDVTVGEVELEPTPEEQQPTQADVRAIEKQKDGTKKVVFVREDDPRLEDLGSGLTVEPYGKAMLLEQYEAEQAKPPKEKYIPPTALESDLSGLYDKAKNASDFVGESAQDLVKGAVAVGTLPQTLVKGAAGAVANYLLPNTMGAGGEKLSWGKVNAPQAAQAPAGPAPASSTGPAPVAQGTPPPAAGAPGGSMSMKMSRSGGGKALPAAAMPKDPFAAEQAILNKQSKEVLDFVTEETKNYNEAAGEYKKSRIEAMKAVTDTALLEKQSMQRQMDEQKVRSDKYNEALEEVRRVSAEGVDPGRFWNNKSTGQKAAAVIAGALFGFQGQGMQWLQRLDNLVAEDVRQQEGDMSRRIGGLKEYAAGQLTLSDRARQAGIDERSMLNIDKAARFEELKLQMENMAAVTQDMTRKSQLMGMSQAMGDKQAALFGEMREFGAQKAMHGDKMALEWAQLNQQKEEFAFKQGGGGGETGPELKPVEKESMAEMQTWADGLGRMIADYKSARGDSWAATGAVSGAVGGVTGNSTKSARWKDAVIRWAQILGKPLEGGVVREEDSKRYEKSYIPKMSEVTESAEQKAKDLAAYAISKYTNMYNSHRGVDAKGWRSFKTPEQFAAEVRSVLSSSVPGERKR